MFQANFTAAQMEAGCAAGFNDVEWLSASLTNDNGGVTDFSTVFKQAHAEIAEIIENGFGPSGAISSLVASMSVKTPVRWQGGSGGPQRVERGVHAGMSTLDASRQAFLAEIEPWSRLAGKQLGVSPNLIAAHAALESGWGQRSLRFTRGGETYNLFGVKAGTDWRGLVVNSLTTEYINNADVKVIDRFRAYPDYRSAFTDYVRLLQNNPRYAAALKTGNDVHAFGNGLVRGGYTTDPNYVDKLYRCGKSDSSARTLEHFGRCTSKAPLLGHSAW